MTGADRCRGASSRALRGRNFWKSGHCPSRHREEAQPTTRSRATSKKPWIASLPAVARSDGGGCVGGCARYAREPFVCCSHQQEDARLTRQAGAANPAPQCLIREEPAGWRRRALPHPAAVIARKPQADDAIQSHRQTAPDRKRTRLNSSHVAISYAVFCVKKKVYRQLPHW